MSRSRIHALVAGSLVLLGCATAKPLYQMTFSGTAPDVRDRWIRLLATRYNCDTAQMTGTAAPVSSGRPGAQPSQPPMIDMGPDVSGKRMIVPNPTYVAPSTAGGSPLSGPPLGSTPCKLADATPSQIRVFVNEGQMREEWMRGGLLTYEFKGPDPAHLRLTFAPRR